MNKLMVLSALLIVAGFALAAYYYPQIPGTKIASHWNEKSEVDGHMDKFWGVFLFPLITLPMFLLFVLIPRIDPLKKNIQEFRKYYDGFIVVFLAFFLYLQALVIAWNIGYRPFNMGFALMPGFAALFYFIGVMLKHSKRNWFVGIRTPWTLSNDEVWDKTHKAGSAWFQLMAVYFLLLMFIEYVHELSSLFFWLMLAPILLVSLGLAAYSYWLYSKLERKKKPLKG